MNEKTILFQYNVDMDGNPVSVKLKDESQVSTLKHNIQLEQLPDEQYGVVVLDASGKSMKEVYNYDDLENKPNAYYVNYTTGIVHFNSSQSAERKIINYYGTGVELISAKRVFDGYYKASGEYIYKTLQEIIDAGREAIEAMTTIGNVSIILQNLSGKIAEGNIVIEEIKELKQEIAQAINVTGNEVVNISAGDWAYNPTSKMYEYTINHTMNSKDLIISCYDFTTGDFVLCGGKIVNNNSVLIKSETNIDLKVVLNARYYKTTLTISDEIAREVVDARKTHKTVGERLDNFDSQLDDIVQEVNEDYYKKNTVNAMVNIKVTTGEARENTDVRPINYREFDTETKQLFTGGSVSVVGEKAVGTENVKDLAITSNKRTTTGSAVKISSLSPEHIKLDVNNKKLILPVSDYNLIYYNNKFDKLVSGLEIDVSGNGTTCSLYYDSVSKSFKTFENDVLNENCILIGTVFWNNTDGNYINSNLNCDYVLKNGDEINHKIMGRISNNFIYPQGKEIRIFSAYPIDIDLVNRKLVINKSGYCKVLINGYLRNVLEDEIDISINDYHVSILYDATTNTLKSDLVYDSETSTTKNNYLLGVIDIKNPYLSTINCNYTVNGVSYNQHLLSQRWKGKKIGCLGDSITFGAGGTSWVTKLTELTGCKEALNYGVSGTCIQENGTGKSFVERYSSMTDDLDLICVWGGVNDHHWTGSSGRKFGDINTSTSEINTFYGALKKLCEGLLNKYPTKTIMFITPMKNKGYVSGSTTCPAWNEKNGLEGGVGRTLTDYRNAIIEVCDFYSIPVLDLYALSGISPENEKQVENLMPDRLHPNTKGNLEILAPKIASFMNNL